MKDVRTQAWALKSEGSAIIQVVDVVVNGKGETKVFVHAPGEKVGTEHMVGSFKGKNSESVRDYTVKLLNKITATTAAEAVPTRVALKAIHQPDDSFPVSCNYIREVDADTEDLTPQQLAAKQGTEFAIYILKVKHLQKAVKALVAFTEVDEDIAFYLLADSDAPPILCQGKLQTDLLSKTLKDAGVSIRVVEKEDGPDSDEGDEFLH